MVKSGSGKTKLKKLHIELPKAIIESIEEKKGKEIVTLDLTTIQNAVADYFIICHGDSRTQVETIAGFIEENVARLTGQVPDHVEGYDNAEWILIDYFNVVIHVFQEDIRRHYKLENLWGDAEVVHLTKKTKAVRKHA
jgi:ribosome-associated protein